MELTIYDKNNSKEIPYQLETRLMNVNCTTGRIRFSKALVEELKMNEQKTVLIAYDNDQKAWYICVGTNAEGFSITPNKDSLGIWSKYLGRKILSGLKSDRASFLVSKDPVKVGTDVFYKILTSSPLRTEDRRKTK